MVNDLDLGFEEQTERPRRRRGTRRRRGSGGGRSFLAFVLALLILGALGGGVWYGVDKVSDFFSAPDYNSGGTGEVVVQVEKGQTASDIALTLERNGVVKSSKAFVNAAKEDPRSTQIEPGYYKLRKQMRASDALGLLLDDAARDVRKVTVQEGLTFRETYAVLAKATGIPLAQFEAAGKDPIALGVPDFWFNRSDGKQVNRSVEGFLYPSTYEFPPTVTAEAVLKAMVAQFLKVANELDLVNVAQAKGVTPFEALITASLVEGESGIDEDMPKVSRVVYNRLKQPMELEFDSTTNYWRELQGQPRKPNLNDAELKDPNNPYRTYGLAGLPPGPIGNPGRKALDASINPAAGTWLFFVAIDKTGRSAFADNLPEHERNIQTAIRNGVFK